VLILAITQLNGSPDSQVIHYGRPRSSREALGTRFIDALSEVFQKKGKAAINKLADTDPATFVRVCASLMPKELLISQGPLADLSSQEIAALAYAARKAVALADAAQEGEGTGKLIQEQARSRASQHRLRLPWPSLTAMAWQACHLSSY
jgi:hypothetical protein